MVSQVIHYQTKDLSERLLLETIIDRWQRIRSGEADVPFPYETLADRFPKKVVLSKMEKLDAIGAINYGVSLRTAWAEIDYLEKYHPDLAGRATPTLPLPKPGLPPRR